MYSYYLCLPTTILKGNRLIQTVADSDEADLALFLALSDLDVLADSDLFQGGLCIIPTLITERLG